MKNMGITMGAAVCAVCGLAGLAAAVHLSHPVLCPISSVSEPGSYVACEGIVWETFQNQEHTFVTLFDGSPILVPLFNFSDKISVGDLLQVEGTVSLYKGRLELIPKKWSAANVIYGRCVNSVLYTEQGTFSVPLADGDYALAGSTKEGQLLIERCLQIPLVSLEGRICDISTGGSSSTFLLYGDYRTFVSFCPLSPGTVKGFGVQSGQTVRVLYYTWEPLAVDSIAQARRMPEGYPITISGIIESVTASNGHIFMVIEDSTGSILVPIFSDLQSQLQVDVNSFHEDQSLTVTGIVHLYNGKVELIPVTICA
ncbi:MAG: OB-fold nucleic acid binding domain-containing protein [Theionarchaea archaeon]|nr:OB-fold nucleic acid binding domain-containing protein [Theionarchaea archaeon]